MMWNVIKSCPRCGAPVSEVDQRCPICKEVLKAPNQQTPAQQNQPQSYPPAQNQVYAPPQPQPYAPQPYVPSQQYVPPQPTMYVQQTYIPPQPMKRYGANIPLIILSIFNIAVGWCCGIGTILGIIALIQAIDRKDAKNDEEARKATLLSLLFNGIALFVLACSIIVPIIKFGSLVGGYEQMLEMFM